VSAVISCRGATRRYERRGAPPVVAVDHVDLEVAEGESVAIEGPSGSGKTTLLGLLAGLEPADEGAVTVVGHDVGRLSPAERARLRRTRMGIVFQSFGLVPSLDALENVALPLALEGIARTVRLGRAEHALDRVGLGDRLNARPDELSGGQRQRVGIARAIAADPAIILADEPTGSLDDETAASILALLRAQAKVIDASLVLVTHDPASAAAADRRVRKRDGRLEVTP
jgi:putative ABC transport system ATP-binding protein